MVQHALADTQIGGCHVVAEQAGDRRSGEPFRQTVSSTSLKAAAHHLAIGDVGSACAVVTNDALTLGVRIAVGKPRDIVEDCEADDGDDRQEEMRCREALALA